MKKLILVLMFIVFMVRPCMSAVDPSIDDTATWKNAYRFTDQPNKDLFLDWCQAMEDTLNAFDANSFAPLIITDLNSVAMDPNGTGFALASVAEAQDFDIALTGATDSSIILTSSGTGDDAIGLVTSAGGINIVMTGGAAGEDFEITTATSIDFSSSEAAADQFKMDATGTVAGNAINFETTDGGILLNADGSDNGDIGVNAADDLTLTAGGDLALAVTGNVTGNILGDGSDTLMGYLRGVEVEPATSEQLLVADSGKIFVNTAAQGATTYTLPDAAAGLIFTFVDNSATGGDDVIIDCASGDNIDHDTNGDAIESVSDEASASITLIAINGTDWITMCSNGTWSAQ